MLIFGFLIAINIVLFIVSGLMYLQWRNQTYLKLLGASLLTVLSSIGMLCLSLKVTSFYMFFVAMYTLGYIIMQIGLFRLYYTKRVDKLYLHLAGTATVVLIAAMSLFLPVEMSGLLLFLVVTALSAYSTFKLFPEPAVKLRNLTVLILYLLNIVMLLIGVISKSNSFTTIGLLFCVGSAFTVFVMVFERVMNLMQAATYTSTRDEVTGLFTRKHFLSQANQAILQKNALGVLYIEINQSQISEHISYEELIRRAGKAVSRFTDGIGFSGRYEDQGIVVMITKSSVPLQEVANSLRMRIEVEISESLNVGYIDIKTGTEVIELINEAKEGANRTQKNGVFKVHDLNQSKILSD